MPSNSSTAERSSSGLSNGSSNGATQNGAADNNQSNGRQKSEAELAADRLYEERIEEEERIAKANESSVRFLQLSLQLFFQWGYDSFAFLQPFLSFVTYTKDDAAK